MSNRRKTRTERREHRKRRGPIWRAPAGLFTKLGLVVYDEAKDFAESVAHNLPFKINAAKHLLEVAKEMGLVPPETAIDKDGAW